MDGVTICVMNQKGGSGKSSSCFHLAGYYATDGLNVLAVDADPQGSLSQGFFGSEIVESLEPQETLAAIFDDESYFSTLEHLPARTAFQRISVVRANNTLAIHNAPAPEHSGLKQFAMQSFLDTVGGFDIVLVDCPPTLYQCSWNAMLAADYVLIPVPPEDFGTQGLRAVHQAVENARALNPRLELLGHVVTRSDSRLLIHQSYESKLRQLYGDLVLDTVIPEVSAFKVALGCRQPVSLYSPSAPAARAIAGLGAEILGRISVAVNRRQVV